VGDGGAGGGELDTTRREARIGQDERLADRAQREHGVIAHPVDDPGRRVERVGPVAEQRLVDDSAQHHPERVERGCGDGPDQGEDPRRRVRLSQELQHRDELDEDRDVHDDDDDHDEDVHDQAANVDHAWTEHADRHRRRDRREDECPDHPGGNLRHQEERVPEDHDGRADRQALPEDRQPVPLVGVLITPPHVRQQAE